MDFKQMNNQLTTISEENRSINHSIVEKNIYKEEKKKVIENS
jgi:hypothetical protein